MRRTLHSIVIIASISTLLVAFQNCGGTPFSEVDFQRPTDSSSSCDDCQKPGPSGDLEEVRPEDYSTIVSIEGVLTATEGIELMAFFRINELLDEAIEVSYRLEQGSAYAGSDFVYKEGTVIIPAGEVEASIEIQTLVDEDTFEGQESFLIVVTGVEGPAQTPPPAIVYIEEDPDQFLARGSQSSQLSVGEKSTCAILQFTNVLYTAQEASLDTNDKLRCWGEEPINSAAPQYTYTESTPVLISGGDGFNCYASGTQVECLGAKAGTSRLPRKPINSHTHALGTGNNHACAIVGDDRKLHCWGDNQYGQTGHSNTGADTSTSHVVSFSVGTDTVTTKVQAIAAGSNHTCAIVRGGLHCWGDNRKNQIGVGNTSANQFASPQPVQNMQSGVTAVAAGRAHTCAVKDGQVLCWGDNQYAQLGNGGTNGYNLPALVLGLSDVTEIRRLAAGNDHTCVLTYGQIRCWGDSTKGQVGDGQGTGNISTASPVNMPTSYISDIGAGGNHTCAIFKSSASDGKSKVACWGDGAAGQLGTGNMGTSNSPSELLGLDVLAHFNSQRASEQDTSSGGLQIGDGDSPFTSGGGFGL